MLRIAEHNTKTEKKIDLKELEKFGYELEEDWWNRPKTITKDDVTGYEIYYKHVALYTSIEIEVETRRIIQQTDDLFTKVNKKYIEDLIEAGYVEKVEGK